MWIVNNGAVDVLLLYVNCLYLVGKYNLELGKSILKAIDFTIIGSRIPYCYKNAVCSTDFNLNLEDFSTLPRFVLARNFVSQSKSIFKVVVNALVLVIFLQLNPLVLVLFVQLKPLVIEISVRAKLTVLVLSLQAFVIVMLV